MMSSQNMVSLQALGSHHVQRMQGSGANLLALKSPIGGQMRGSSKYRSVGGRVVYQSLGERTSSMEQLQAVKKEKTPEKEIMQQETVISPTLASRWREVLGANNWKGLLDPLDMDLRMELVRYGEFAQACYDAFDNQSHSKYMGSCLFNKERMFYEVGLPDTGYEITDYLFATTSVDSLLLRNEAPDAWSRCSNWIGYIAVCTDLEKIKKLGRRDIVLAWRGTATKLEWAADLKRDMVPDHLDDRAEVDATMPWNQKVKILNGFMNLYTTANTKTRYNKASVREQVLTEIRRLIELYEDEDLSITITGHSLGGAMAVLSAYDIAMSEVNIHGANVAIKDFEEKSTVIPSPDPSKRTMVGRKIPVTAFTFASPRVGNNPFADKVRELGVKVLRINNVKDVVPKVPSLVFNEEFTYFNNALDYLPCTYSHVGEYIDLDHDMSPELRDRGNPLNAHNLEAYLHLLTGYHSPGKPFKPVVDRDLALINKASEFVCPRRTGIPGNWWQPMNKGLKRSPEGKWVQVEREFEDVPDHILAEKRAKEAEGRKDGTNQTSMN